MLKSFFRFLVVIIEYYLYAKLNIFFHILSIIRKNKPY